eukprot:3579396-Pyramimonas_sp.AAC.1
MPPGGGGGVRPGRPRSVNFEGKRDAGHKAGGRRGGRWRGRSRDPQGAAAEEPPAREETTTEKFTDGTKQQDSS